MKRTSTACRPRRVHFQPVDGASGNMLLASLIAARALPESISRALRDLDVPFKLDAKLVEINGVSALQATVEHSEEHVRWTFREVRALIEDQAAILEAARLFELGKVVWASSVVAFGSHSSHAQSVLPNDAHRHPVNLYGVTRPFDEFLTDHYTKKWWVDALRLWFTVVYGPRRVRGASSFINELVKPTLGDNVVDWQYVEVTAELLVKCASLPRTRTSACNTQFDRRSIRGAGKYVTGLILSAQITYQSGEFGIAWGLDDSILQEEIDLRAKVLNGGELRETLRHARWETGLSPLTSLARLSLDRERRS